jgi:tetratricopeptide (TPR) repeat protein
MSLGDSNVPPNDLAASVNLLAARAQEAVARHDLTGLTETTDALLLVADDALAHGDPAITRTLLGIALLAHSVHDLVRAEALTGKGIQALQQNPRATICDCVWAYGNYLNLQRQKGDVAAANRAAVAICQAAAQMTEPVTREAMDVFLTLAQLYERSGNVEASLLLYGQVHQHMVRDAAVLAATLQEWTAVYLTRLCGAQKFSEAMAAGRAAFERVVAMAAPFAAVSVKSALYLSQAAGALNDKAGSRAWLEKAVGMIEELERGPEPVEHEGLQWSSVAHHNLAVLWLQTQQPEDARRAEELLRKSLALVLRLGKAGTADHAGEVAQLAGAVEQRGDLIQAERLYREALGIYENAARRTEREETDYINFLKDYGQLLLRQERPTEAIAPFERAMALAAAGHAGPGAANPEMRASLGLAYFRSAQWTEASQAFRAAIEQRLALNQS